MNDLRTILVIFLVCTALLFGCSSRSMERIAEQGGKRLTAAEIQSLVSGNTLNFEEHQDQAVIEMYENGTLWARKDDYNDENKGRWSTDEKDRLCIKFRYRKWGAGDEACYAIFQFDDEYRQYTKGGIMVSRFTVNPGTTKGPPSKTARRRPKKEKAESPAPAPTAEPRRQVITKSTPAVQEEPITPPSYDPNAQRDLRFIYREMSKNCPGCNLTNIDLAGASLLGANLAGADLTGSNLSKVNLKRANLKGATLVRTNLSGANLAGADLAGADLTGADLTGANLTRTNLKGADLTRVEGADLSNAIR